MFSRTPSKQKSPRKEGDIDIVELLRGHDPKDYERILQEHGIHDYRAILQAVEFLKKEKEMETGKVVSKETYLGIMFSVVAGTSGHIRTVDVFRLLVLRVGAATALSSPLGRRWSTVVGWRRRTWPDSSSSWRDVLAPRY